MEDEIVSATTVGKEEVRCRYGRGGAQVAILGKMKIAENDEQRYGIAGHVGQVLRVL
jgi:hypothetical protein